MPEEELHPVGGETGSHDLDRPILEVDIHGARHEHEAIGGQRQCLCVGWSRTFRRQPLS